MLISSRYFPSINSILGGTALWLAYETKGLLIGESADQTVVAGIIEITSQDASIEYVNEVLTMHMGPEFVLVNISVDFNDATTADALESSIAKLDRQIKNKFPRLKRIFIEAEQRAKVKSISD